MLPGEALDVARLHNRLAHFIKHETGDDYFDFDELSEEDLGEKLSSFSTDFTKRIFIAKENDQVIGFIAGEIINCFLPISKVQKVGYVAGAYVLPEHRGKRVMTNLEQRLIEHFKNHAIGYIELNVISKNSLAKKCWGSLGYTTFREQMRKEI